MQVIVFHATWCKESKKFMKVIEKVRDKVPFKIEEVLCDNLDKDFELNKILIKYNIHNIPTILLVDDQKEIIRIGPGNILTVKRFNVIILNRYIFEKEVKEFTNNRYDIMESKRNR